MVSDLLAQCPQLASKIEFAIKSLNRSRNKAQYDLFYDVQPLVQFVNSDPVKTMTPADLRSKLVVALRLCTLARSADIANLLPALWLNQGQYYCRLKDKMGRD